MLKPKISVIIVSFNTQAKLRRCLQCIEPHHEIVVVDNASIDGSAEMVSTDFPYVKLIANDRNLGFGSANNQGCSLATGDLVLFLNSDAYADPGAIDALAQVFADEDVVAAGGKLLNPDRSLQLSTANRLTLWAVLCEQTYLEKVFPSSGFFSPYWTTLRLAESAHPSPTPQVMGACLMVRADHGKPIELFDERYFLYCEDTDLCRRLTALGTILYVPAATFVHDLGSSSTKDPALGIIRYNRGKELYFRIHHGVAARTTCLVLNRMGALLRLSAWLVKLTLSGYRSTKAKSQVRSFWKVLQG